MARPACRARSGVRGSTTTRNSYSPRQPGCKPPRRPPGRWFGRSRAVPAVELSGPKSARLDHRYYYGSVPNWKRLSTAPLRADYITLNIRQTPVMRRPEMHCPQPFYVGVRRSAACSCPPDQNKRAVVDVCGLHRPDKFRGTLAEPRGHHPVCLAEQAVDASVDIAPRRLDQAIRI